jgi:hypothetical protein
MTAVIIPKSAPFNNPTSGGQFEIFLDGGFRGSVSVAVVVSVTPQVQFNQVYTPDVYTPEVFL